MLFNELPIAFPWYEKEEQQNRFNENVEPFCDYKLISPSDALLPFQFTKEATGANPVDWEIYEVNSKVKVADLDSSLSLLHRHEIEGKDYFSYHGGALTASGSPLNLPMGWYYSRMTWGDGTLRWSEMFHVPEGSNFNIGDDDDIDFLKIEWYNMTDMRPIFYNDIVSGKPYFRNVAYLDTFITASEPEIIEEGERDGNDEIVPTFQKALIKYRITALVPDFLKKAMMLLPIHDHVIITTKRGVRTGEIFKSVVTSTVEAPGAFSVVDILFEETIIMRKGCADNMVIE